MIFKEIIKISQVLTLNSIKKKENNKIVLIIFNFLNSNVVNDMNLILVSAWKAV